MKRIQLVVTGKCERLALHLSLGQLFPSAQWLTPIAVDSFTSAPLTEAPPRGVKRTLEKFADKLIGFVDESGAETLVVGVDDLELESPADLTVTVVRDAVESALMGPNWALSAPRRERLQSEVASRCSFHLLVPMVEAYFFADPAALGRAGARGRSTFDPALCDVEDFLVEDERYLAPEDTSEKHDWCRGGTQRARHPKRYLKFLSGDGTPGSWSYRESREGEAALRSLDWALVLATSTWARAARALIDDIASFMEADQFPGLLLETTALSTHRRSRTLRNV